MMSHALVEQSNRNPEETLLCICATFVDSFANPVTLLSLGFNLMIIVVAVPE